MSLKHTTSLSDVNFVEMFKRHVAEDSILKPLVESHTLEKTNRKRRHDDGKKEFALTEDQTTARDKLLDTICYRSGTIIIEEKQIDNSANAMSRLFTPQR